MVARNGADYQAIRYPLCAHFVLTLAIFHCRSSPALQIVWFNADDDLLPVREAGPQPRHETQDLAGLLTTRSSP